MKEVVARKRVEKKPVVEDDEKVQVNTKKKAKEKKKRRWSASIHRRRKTRMNRVHAQSPDDVSSGRATGDSVEIKESRRGGASGTGDNLWQPTTLAKREEDVSPSAGQQLHHPTPIVPDVSRSSENIDIENCCYHSEDSNDLAVAAIIGCTDIDQVRFLPYHRHLQPTTTFFLDFLHSTFLFILKTFLKNQKSKFYKKPKKIHSRYLSAGGPATKRHVHSIGLYYYVL